MTNEIKDLKLEYSLGSIERNMQTAKTRNVFNVLIEQKDFRGKKVYYCTQVIMKRLHEQASFIVYWSERRCADGGTIILGIIFSLSPPLSFPSSAQNPRRVCHRILNFCMGS